MSAQSRATGRQADRTSILEGESSGPSYGAAEPEGGSRQSVVLPDGVTSRQFAVETDAERHLLGPPDRPRLDRKETAFRV